MTKVTHTHTRVCEAKTTRITLRCIRATLVNVMVSGAERRPLHLKLGI